MTRLVTLTLTVSAPGRWHEDDVEKLLGRKVVELEQAVELAALGVMGVPGAVAKAEAQ